MFRNFVLPVLMAGALVGCTSIKPTPFVANYSFNQQKQVSMERIGNPDYSRPVALGIVAPEISGKTLRLKVTNLDEGRVIFDGEGVVNSGQNGHFVPVAGIVPFYHYRAEFATIEGKRETSLGRELYFGSSTHLRK